MLYTRAVDLKKTTKLNSTEKPTPPAFERSFHGSLLYEEGLRLQQECLRSQVSRILGLQHPTVITLGRRYRESFLSEASFNFPKDPQNQIPIVITDRGGELTLHSPGQLMIYPILPLAHRGWTLKNYLAALLLSARRCLLRWGVSTTSDGRGVFADGKKIVSMGVRVSGGWTQHGLAMNISNDLALFQGLEICGVRNREMTSLENELTTVSGTKFELRGRVPGPGAGVPNLEEVFEEWVSHFEKYWNQAQSPNLDCTCNLEHPSAN